MVIVGLIIMVILGIAAGALAPVAGDAGGCWASLAAAAIEAEAEAACPATDQPVVRSAGAVRCPDGRGHPGGGGTLLERDGRWRRTPLPGGPAAGAVPAQRSAAPGTLFRGVWWGRADGGIEVEWAGTWTTWIAGGLAWLAGAVCCAFLAWLAFAVLWEHASAGARVLLVVFFGGAALWFPVTGAWRVFGSRITVFRPADGTVHSASRLFGVTWSSSTARPVAVWESGEFLWVLPEQDGAVGRPMAVAPAPEGSPLPAAIIGALY
jgi:hypothetical protein